MSVKALDHEKCHKKIKKYGPNIEGSLFRGSYKSKRLKYIYIYIDIISIYIYLERR